jgi:ATP-dependent Clp protease ATP-binding subunit ClpA
MQKQQPLTTVRFDKTETKSIARQMFFVDLVDSPYVPSPVIGRDDEIDQVIRILSRKTNNNVLLIGPQGEG